MTTDAAFGLLTWRPAAPRHAVAVDHTDLELHLAASRMLVQRRRREGDRVRQPRTIDHLAVFSTKRAALTAVSALTAAGFRVDGLERHGLRVRVQFSACTAIDSVTAAAFTRQLIELVGGHGGAYSGWCANWMSADFSLELYRESLVAA